MNFKKAIITTNEHTYNVKDNLKSRLIRVVLPVNGLQFYDDRLQVYLKVYGLKVVDGKDVLFNIPSLSNDSTYEKIELDGVFTSLNTPITPDKSFLEQFNSLLLNVLIADTMQIGMFNGDAVVPYTGDFTFE